MKKLSIIMATALLTLGACQQNKQKDEQLKQTNMNTNQQLTLKEQSIVKIASLTSIGNIEQLKAELKEGLDAGLTINEIKEILVQLYAYCGFPKSLNAINAFMVVLEERKGKGIADIQGKEATAITNTTDKYEQGKKVLEVLTKIPQTKPAKGFGEFSPRIDQFLKEHLFADIFENDILTYQQRELVTISALAVMAGAEPQLKAHIAMGLNTGITENQLTQVFSLTAQISNTNSVFPKGQPLPNDWFSGNAFLTPLVAKDRNNDFSAGSVTFEIGARTNWHTHPKGQILLVIEGNGFYQEKGKPAQPIKKGDVVNIPENVEHWHGATATSKMVHIAITNYKDDVQVTWLQPVTDEEFAKVNNSLK